MKLMGLRSTVVGVACAMVVGMAASPASGQTSGKGGLAAGSSVGQHRNRQVRRRIDPLHDGTDRRRNDEPRLRRRAIAHGERTGSQGTGKRPAGVVVADFVTSAVSVSGPDPIDTFVWERTIDQSGLLANYVSGVTDFDAYVGLLPTHLRSNDPANYAASFEIAPLNIDFDLGFSTLVTRLALWNYPFASSGAIIDFNAFTAQSADFSDSVLVGSFAALDDGDRVLNTVQVFDLVDSSARYVRIGVLTGASFFGTGLSEVAFGIAAPDSDGDGIPDDEDACPESILTATIVIDGCDSGVGNMLFEDGCTMADLIAQCADGASNHGVFVSCVAQLTNDWKQSRLISGQEKGQIQSCAAQADIPGDLDGDGSVGIADLLQLFAAYGPCEGCPADLNGDGMVGILDLLILLGNWG